MDLEIFTPETRRKIWSGDFWSRNGAVAACARETQAIKRNKGLEGWKQGLSSLSEVHLLAWESAERAASNPEMFFLARLLWKWRTRYSRVRAITLSNALENLSEGNSRMSAKWLLVRSSILSKLGFHAEALDCARKAIFRTEVPPVAAETQALLRASILNNPAFPVERRLKLWEDSKDFLAVIQENEGRGAKEDKAQALLAVAIFERGMNMASDHYMPKAQKALDIAARGDIQPLISSILEAFPELKKGPFNKAA